MSPSPTTAPRVWQDSDLLNGSGMFQLRSLVARRSARANAVRILPQVGQRYGQLSWISEKSVKES